jgi:hypothetical protein
MKINKTALVLIVMASTGMGYANALSAAESAIQGIGVEIAALSAAAWPIVVSLVMAFIGMKLFKKFANKAS